MSNFESLTGQTSGLPVNELPGSLCCRYSSQGVNRVSQVTGSSPLVRATVTHPARWTISSPFLPAMALLPSGCSAPWAPGICIVSWPYPVAHTFVDLRIAGTVTHPVARPYFRPAGLSIGRVGFAPTGGLTEFQSVSPPPSLRTSLAWSLLNMLALLDVR